MLTNTTTTQRLSLSAPAEYDQLRANLVRAITYLGVVLAAAGLATTLTIGLATGAFNQRTSLIILIFGVVCIFAISLERRGRLQSATLVLISVLLVAHIVNTTNMLTATLVILLAATQPSITLYRIVNLIVIPSFLIQPIATTIQTESFTIEFASAGLQIMALIVMSVTVRTLVNAAQKAITSSRRAADQIEISANIQRIITQTLDPRSVLEQSVRLIKEQFGYDRAQIYMIDEAEGQAVLAVSTSTNMGISRIPVSASNPIGQTAARGMIVISRPALERAKGQSTTSETTYLAVTGEETLLPAAGSEIALPMKEGDKVIGVLNIQSRRVDAFAVPDQRALQIVADLLATAIRNARLFESQSHIAEENRKLYERAEGALREVERLNRELTRATWQDYLEGERPQGVTLEQDTLIVDSRWTGPLTQAQAERRPVTRMDGEQPVVAVPVVLRGEVIGAIEIEPGAQADEDAVEIAEAVAERLAISLENARLYEQAQQATIQEQRINMIAAQFQEATSVDDLLRITLEELSDVLGAEQASIRLGNVNAGDQPIPGRRRARATSEMSMNGGGAS
jgi:GAF domain-containing protein